MKSKADFGGSCSIAPSLVSTEAIRGADEAERDFGAEIIGRLNLLKEGDLGMGMDLDLDLVAWLKTQ